jgi:hypothetical protein
MRAPYELARGHIALAELALEAGRPGTAGRELERARASLERLGASGELERVAALEAHAEAASSPYDDAPAGS